ncbi:MAG TPA: hypothetical protein DDY90_05775 [Clostridiales bacterium]|nr:hypothetical protein [Clostridiales bacterium]
MLYFVLESKGSSDEIGESWRPKILAQPKVLEAEEYCMYFPLSELHGWGKRFAAQPKTISPEFPKKKR